ncbi:hypothetical protein Tco_0982493 [Tanacetum coccineum]
MTTIAQQIALDNSLVALEYQHGISKCNMRINPGMKPKEPTYQVVLDALALTTCYHAFLIIANVPVIYMHQFWATVNKHNASYQFKIDNKRFSVNVKVFREILNICPKIPGQVFDELPSEKKLYPLSKNLVILERSSTSPIYDSQDFKSFRIDNKESKKQDMMYYPRFTMVIIHQFLTKDKSISMQNRTFMHTARDDSLLGTMRFISRNEDTQPKKTQKKSDSAISSKETPSNKNPAKAKKDVPITKKPATKPKPTKKKASAKADRGKGDGTDIESGVPHEQQHKISSTDEGTGTKSGVPDVPKYDSESEKESWGDSREEEDDDDDDTEEESDNDGNDDDADNDDNDDNGDNDDNDDDSDHERTEDNADNVKEETKEEIDDAEELYRDVNMNLRKKDVEMTDADQGGADQHNVSQESGFNSFVSSDFTDKLRNFENASPTGNEIASLMDTTVRHEEPRGHTSSHYIIPVMVITEITSSFTTTIPSPPPSFNPLLQQATPTPTPTASEVTTSFPALLDFSSLFRFNDRVTNLERDLSKMKQVDQHAQAISSIPAIVDRYIGNKQEEAIQQAINESYYQRGKLLEVVVLAKSSSQPKSTYAAAASLSDFELTKILMDKMEEHKSYLRAEYKKELYDALVKSYNTNKDLFETYGEVFTLKRSRDDKDKDQDPSTGSDRGTKRRKSKEPSHTVDDSGVQQNQEFDTGNNDEQPDDEAASKVDCNIARAEKPPTSFDELMDTPINFFAFVMNRLNITNLTQELLVRLAFNLLMRYFSFGGHLEELHVTWAHLEKKRTRLQTYTNIAQEFLLRGWRRRHRYNVMTSQQYPRWRHEIP